MYTYLFFSKSAAKLRTISDTSKKPAYFLCIRPGCVRAINLTQRHRVTQSYYSLQVSDVNKNIKNPSADVFALCAFVLTSWLCACEQAPAPALTSSLVALQLNTSSEEKTPFRLRSTEKQLRIVEMFFRLEKPRIYRGYHTNCSSVIWPSGMGMLRPSWSPGLLQMMCCR